MKKAHFSLFFLLLLTAWLLFTACGGEEDGHAAQWQAERESGGYSADYLLTPERKFCARLSADGDAVEIFDSASGNRCGVLDFAARDGAGLYPDFALELLEFTDRDGDGYSDFGVPMADGAMVWYKYRFGSDPSKQQDCFSFLELQPDAIDLPSGIGEEEETS